MRALNPWQLLLQSLGYLCALLVDSLTVIGAFAILGMAALVVHKSVEKLQIWGVPSTLIEGMEVLHVCVWAVDALAVLWLCGVAAIKFCRKVMRG